MQEEKWQTEVEAERCMKRAGEHVASTTTHENLVFLYFFAPPHSPCKRQLEGVEGELSSVDLDNLEAL